MSITTPANYVTALDSRHQTPVYFLSIDGYTAREFSTGPVKSAVVTKERILGIPELTSRSIDIVSGRYTAQEVEVELLDKSDWITNLIATEASGAPVSTLINRKATIKGGYAHLSESDYATIFTGQIRGVKMNDDLTGYVLSIVDVLGLLDGEIMANASDAANSSSIARGNIVNLYYAILADDFDESHATFPLDTISDGTPPGTTPTGLGIPSALINTSQLEDERDKWHPTTSAALEFKEPVSGRGHLDDEFFRVFQCFPTVSGEGKIGLKFHTPAMPPSAAVQVKELDHIVGVRSWRRVFEDHLNKFTIRGDYNLSTNEFDTDLYSTETSADTADQSATGETIEYLVESKWLETTYYAGNTFAGELAGRMRARYLKTPAEVDIAVNFRRRNLEVGDAVAVFHSDIPDMLTGTRGVNPKLMTVISIRPDFQEGVLVLTCMDYGSKRYGVIAPSGTGDYGSATAIEKETFAWIGATSTNLVGGTDPGYRGF